MALFHKRNGLNSSLSYLKNSKNLKGRYVLDFLVILQRKIKVCCSDLSLVQINDFFVLISLCFFYSGEIRYLLSEFSIGTRSKTTIRKITLSAVDAVPPSAERETSKNLQVTFTPLYSCIIFSYSSYL